MKLFIVLIILGVALLAVGLRQMRAAEAFMAQGVKTQGTILSMDKRPYMHTKGKSRDAFYPTVKFLAEGKEYQFISDMAGTEPQYKQGDGVEVIYDPANPADAKINQPASVKGLAYLLLGLGTIAVLAGFLGMRRLTP